MAPLELSPTINDEVQKAHLSVIDLIQVDFGGGLERRWSTIDVPARIAAGLSGDYDARLLSIGDRVWTLGADDDSVTLELGNADGEINNFVRNYGIDIFEGSRVRHHRLFPGIQEVYKDYWVGKGSSVIFEGAVASWDVKFGLGALRQRALRRFQRNCAHVFAGGLDSDCPYSPEKGFGVPQAILFGSATAGTNNNVLVASRPDAFSQVYAGMLAYNRDANCVSRVLNVSSLNQLELSSPVAGAGIGTPARWRDGDRYTIGPPYTSCAKTSVACDSRGMYGPNDRNRIGLMDERKYFGGSNDVANITFSGRLPDGGDRFTRSTLGNASFDGNPIPVIFGRIRIYGRESLAHAPGGEFQHGMFIIGEGEIYDITLPIVNENPPDNVGNINEIKKENRFMLDESAVAHSDSFIKFGTWHPNGVDDERVMAVDSDMSRAVARHVRECGGRRASVGTKFGYRVLDAYHWRDGISGIINNPYLFADSVGGGISMHGLCGVRIRIETNQDIKSTLTGDFTISGLLTPLPVGMPNNSEDGTRFDLPKIAGVSPHKYTTNPNPIQAAYAFLTNNRWGSGLSDASILLDSFLLESEYCEDVIVAAAASTRTQLVGSVDYVPQWAEGRFTPAHDKFFSNSIITDNVDARPLSENFAQSLVGRQITFSPRGSGESFTAYIDAALFLEDPTDYSTTYDQQIQDELDDYFFDPSQSGVSHYVRSART